jgi:hypothetical protein
VSIPDAFEARVPDAPERGSPVVAWRAWTVVRDQERFRLASVVAKTIWQPHVALSAECVRIGWRWPRRARHLAPDVDCECGIYATDRELAIEYSELSSTSRRTGVFGRVALWGLVFECEHGWRASVAYPAEIVILEDRWRARGRYPLEEVAFDLMDYGAPVRLVDADDLELATPL